MSTLLQRVGAVLVLFPFAGTQLWSLGTGSALYLWPNLLGSSVLAVLAVMAAQWGFGLLESFWVLATAWSLARPLRRGSGSTSMGSNERELRLSDQETTTTGSAA